MQRRFAAAVVCTLVAGMPVMADEITSVTQQLCDKTKACMAERFGQATEMSPDMKAMIMQQMEMACSYLSAQYSAAAKGHPIYQPALKCLKSMAALSCDELDAIDDKPTPECREYEALSQQY